MASVTFPPAVGGDGSTVTDDSNASTGLGNGGHRTRFIPCLSQLVAIASNAVANALSAAASAVSALNAPGTTATSTTSTTLATGAKTLTIQTGKTIVVGMQMLAANTSSPATQYMRGTVTAYNSGTGQLDLNIDYINGSGTIATWTVSLTGVMATGFITNIVTATSSTTLTSTKTMLRITPAALGIAVKLPDATTMVVGMAAHAVCNAGAFPVRILDASNKLLGFLPPYQSSVIGLVDNSTTDGIWACAALVKVGACNSIVSSSLGTFVSANAGGYGAIDMDGDIEIILTIAPSTSYVTAVAHKKSTGAFGAVATIRAVASSTSRVSAIKNTATQLLVASLNVGTAFEAVIVTLNASTLALTPNTAATATLTISPTFPLGAGLLSVPSVANSYACALAATGATASQCKALSVSGTTVTIGSSQAVGSSAGGMWALTTADKLIVMTWANASSSVVGDVMTVSGSTLTLGTGFTYTGAGTLAISQVKFVPLATRFAFIVAEASTGLVGLIINLSGTTITKTSATLLTSVTLADAIVVNGKVLVMSTATSSDANLLTDSAGTASAGTAITISADATKYALYASGPSVAVVNNTNLSLLDCSGASPVTTRQLSIGNWAANAGFATCNAQCVRDAAFLAGTNFASGFGGLTYNTQTETLRVDTGIVSIVPPTLIGTQPANATFCKGSTDNSRWSYTSYDNMFVKYEVAA